MQRITFERVRERATYTHFIETNGDTVSLYGLFQIAEARVGVVTADDQLNEAQRLAIIYLANVATAVEPEVEVVFAIGTSPFPGKVPADHPMAEPFDG